MPFNQQIQDPTFDLIDNWTDYNNTDGDDYVVWTLEQGLTRNLFRDIIFDSIVVYYKDETVYMYYIWPPTLTQFNTAICT